MITSGGLTPVLDSVFAAAFLKALGEDGWGCPVAAVSPAGHAKGLSDPGVCRYPLGKP
jgi:hypothetical protein